MSEEITIEEIYKFFPPCGNSGHPENCYDQQAMMLVRVPPDFIKCTAKPKPKLEKYPSYIIQYNDDQRKYAWDFVTQNNIGQRGEADGNKEMQYAGVLAETVLADLLGEPRPEATGFDNGIDFMIGRHKIDLKTMPTNWFCRPEYTNNLMASQVHSENYHNDIYLFSLVNKDQQAVEFIGWIYKKYVIEQIDGIEFFKKGDARPQSNGNTWHCKTDMYEIKNKILMPFVSPEEFKKSLSMP